MRILYRLLKMADDTVKCYLECCKSSHPKLPLPHNVPVIIGRTPELGITDKLCSRSQLELTSNCYKRYVLVKRLGANTSQINGIDIEKNKSSRLEEGQDLHVVNGKFPHRVYFTGCQNDTKTEKAVVPKLPTKSTDLTKSDLSIKQPERKKLKVSENKSKVLNSKIKPQEKFSSESVYAFDSPSPMSSRCEKKAESNKRAPTHKHWSQGLKASMEDPELVVKEDEQIVVIKDKYPKAKYHWLILPKDSISSTKNLSTDNIELLKHILKVGQELAAEVKDKQPDVEFRFGYHAVASMSQMHMHVISQDFQSSSFKTKKHWNSFTTDYFVDATDIINELETGGKVKDRRTMTSLLNEPLKCHRCKKPQKNIPTLKKHIDSCQK
uniref:Aprataxin n=1 Tax=Ciona intestinalis TaxID=7719 RepID=APTX_CIOIN|nr:aprataxin [Ciona intestinalis]P61802.1 RecName: Full=Aprataxin; AltName: Full=Forkhead-associated domain histidine triad-like protein; Short=FHA-HIT [Ciona intestinalis]AAP86338.1 FHA-HIT [Ciona intestinalis]|eukprot:NP_001027704.1 aprataxin [Ciona intestinalis]